MSNVPDSEHEFDSELDDMMRAEFIASFPPIQGAIKRDGAGNGMRVQLDIPESEMAHAIRLQLWTNQLLRVRIEVISPDEQQTRTPGRTRARRRVIESDSSV